MKARIAPSLRLALTAVVVLAALVALAAAPGCRRSEAPAPEPEAPADSAGPRLRAVATSAPVPASAPAGAALVRGVVILSAEAPRMTPCGEAAALPLRDETGGVLAEAYGELASEQTGEAWFEVRGERGPAGLTAYEVVRVLPVGESDPCARLPAPGELRASGNEPFWSVTVGPAGIELRQPDLPEPLVFPPAEPTVEGSTRTWTSRLEGPPAKEIRLVIAPKRCKDGMSGAWSALAAEAVIDGRPVAGCAHEG